MMPSEGAPSLWHIYLYPRDAECAAPVGVSSTSRSRNLKAAAGFDIDFHDLAKDRGAQYLGRIRLIETKSLGCAVAPGGSTTAPNCSAGSGMPSLLVSQVAEMYSTSMRCVVGVETETGHVLPASQNGETLNGCR